MGLPDRPEAARTSLDPEIRARVRGVRPTGAQTQQRIRATLRKSLNDAIAEELITMNPAVYVKTPGRRSKPKVWTDERAAPLAGHRRRGEACGRLDADVRHGKLSRAGSARHRPVLHP